VVQIGLGIARRHRFLSDQSVRSRPEVPIDRIFDPGKTFDHPGGLTPVVGRLGLVL